MNEVVQIAAYAGPMALAAFTGVFLGGLMLSFFWKWFGPWAMLAEAKKALDECHAERSVDAKERARTMAEMADLRASYTILLEAVNRGGLGLRLVPTPPTSTPSSTIIMTTLPPGLSPLIPEANK
jgi:hypothetical protein